MTRPFLLGGPRDHPRSRGVYAHLKRTRPDGYGSSPLVRGLLVMACASRSARGIIPARVGFTVGILYASIWRRDHPRSRGVYSIDEEMASETVGSSPLARGLLVRPESVNADDRIIPARAGFTGRGSSPRRRARDHPRSRGVYRRVPSIAPRVRGSSPLARGLPVNSVGLLYILRIIPARAGFTPDLRRYVHNFPDHPRSRGVYGNVRKGLNVVVGSSPLARGLPQDQAHPGRLLRIIPARAGFTAARILRTRVR